MRKIVLTESQVKRVIDQLMNEQTAEDLAQKRLDASFNATWGNPPIVDQMKKIKPAPNGKYCFSQYVLNKYLQGGGSNKLYLVQNGDTIDKIVHKLGANSVENIYAYNDLLKNNPKNLRAGDVIAYSLAPSGN